MAQPNKPPKTLSSRVLDMPFMQRGNAAKSSPSSLPPSKKQRLSNGAYHSTPSSAPISGTQTPSEEAQTPSKGVTSNQKPGDAAESKWYLSFKTPPAPQSESQLRIISAGFGTLDAAEAEDDSSSEDEDGEIAQVEQVRGRMQFGE